MSAVGRLRAFLAARDDADAAVGETMRSQLFAGSGSDVVVLLHGLTASPPAWHAIARDLNARGATVVVPRLPLHGHTDRLSNALRDLSIEMLTDDLNELLATIAKLGGRVVVAGHSLGGTLAIHAAHAIPGVDRIVAIAPFLGISFLPHETHVALLPVIRALPNMYLWWDPVERDRLMPAHGYPRYPLHALAVGLGMADAVYADADRAPHTPAIDLVLNVRESSVNNRAVMRLAQRWRAARASVAVHRLDGLQPSHDIIEPERPQSGRVRETLVRLIMGEHVADDIIHPV